MFSLYITEPTVDSKKHIKIVYAYFSSQNIVKNTELLFSCLGNTTIFLPGKIIVSLNKVNTENILYHNKSNLIHYVH